MAKAFNCPHCKKFTSRLCSQDEPNRCPSCCYCPDCSIAYQSRLMDDLTNLATAGQRLLEERAAERAIEEERKRLEELP
jgi:hypothetical protein